MGIGQLGQLLNSVERFDPNSGKCSLLEGTMKERRAYAAAATHNGKIHVSGGRANAKLALAPSGAFFNGPFVEEFEWLSFEHGIFCF